MSDIPPVDPISAPPKKRAAKQGELISVKRLEDAPTLALAQPEQQQVSPMLRLAIEQKLDVASIEKLVALEERILDRNAEMAFHDAMAEFQRTCPVIHKAATAEFVTNSGTKVRYVYANLAEIARTIREPLAKVGLSYSWSSKVEGAFMVVTCTVRHRGGHSQSASFTSEIAGTPLMSGSQKAGGAVTFAERYSLIQALGLTTADEDNDAAALSEAGDVTRITESQAANLAALLDEIGTGELARFLKWAKVASLSDIRAADLARFTKAIEEKRKSATS